MAVSASHNGFRRDRTNATLDILVDGTEAATFNNASPYLTVPNGLTVTTGGLTVTAGGLTVTAGGLTVTAGDLTVTAGTVGIGSAVVANQTVTITNATMAATGRGLKLSATASAAALTDGYGAMEVDFTLSGSPTDHSAASSSWVNITGGTVPAGTYICARNDGIYEATAATITNAKLIFGARMQYLADDTDGLRFPFSLNTSNAAITALFDCNNIGDFGTVANAGSSAATVLPFLRTASGTLKYVLLYDLA